MTTQELKDYQKIYKAENREYLNYYHQQWSKKNSKKVKAINDKYLKNHPEYRSVYRPEYQRKYRELNKI
jgi:hypothetical protein